MGFEEVLSKVWPQWKIVKELGQGSFGTVYEIAREDFGGSYRAALKCMSIPKSQREFTDAMSEGMDEQSATTYFKSIMEDLVKEFSTMEKLKGYTNIVSYEDHAVLNHENGVGWDILIRMELLTPLREYTMSHQFLEKDVVKLGIDICSALEVCERKNIVHRDIKPENVFVSDDGDFELGDFGVARTVEKTTSGMSIKGTISYMAPEVYKGNDYNSNVDIYSLGIMLYRLANGGRAPFLPPAPAPISYTDKENSERRRMAGEPLPVIAGINEKLMSIITKAAAYNINERYSSASQMKAELEEIYYAINGKQASVSAAAVNIPSEATQMAQPEVDDNNATVSMFASETVSVVPNPSPVPGPESAPAQAPIPESVPAQAPVPESVPAPATDLKSAPTPDASPAPTPASVSDPKSGSAPMPSSTPATAPSDAPKSAPVSAQNMPRNEQSVANVTKASDNQDAGNAKVQNVGNAQVQNAGNVKVQNAPQTAKKKSKAGLIIGIIAGVIGLIIIIIIIAVASSGGKKKHQSSSGGSSGINKDAYGIPSSSDINGDKTDSNQGTSASTGSSSNSTAVDDATAIAESLDKNRAILDEGKYHAFLTFQNVLGDCEFRNEPYSSYDDFGIYTMEFWQVSKYIDDDKIQRVSGDITDVVLNGSGDYTVAIGGLNISNLGDDNAFTKLMVSTDIPDSMDATFNLLDLKINGTSVRVNTSYYVMDDGHYALVLENYWNQNAYNEFDSVYPSVKVNSVVKTIEISFNVTY